MKIFKIFFLLLPFFCCSLEAKQYPSDYLSLAKEDKAEKTGAFIKQIKKIQQKDHTSSNGDTPKENLTSNLDNGLDDDENMSTKTKVLIGAGAVGIVATALVVKAVVNFRRIVQRRQELLQRYEQEMRGIPVEPFADEAEENEMLWRRAAENIRRGPRPPAAPAEIPGPVLRTIQDITPNAERNLLLSFPGHCDICFDDDAHLVMLENFRGNFCRTCLLNCILTAFNTARPDFDRIRPDPVTTLTRQDIAHITDNNARMLNAFDIAHHNRTHQDPQAQLASVTPEMRRISRPCPHCAAPIQRNTGCRHMTCRCGHEFCWHCQRDCPGGAHAFPDCHNYGYG